MPVPASDNTSFIAIVIANVSEHAPHCKVGEPLHASLVLVNKFK